MPIVTDPMSQRRTRVRAPCEMSRIPQAASYCSATNIECIGELTFTRQSVAGLQNSRCDETEDLLADRIRQRMLDDRFTERREFRNSHRATGFRGMWHLPIYLSDQRTSCIRACPAY